MLPPLNDRPKLVALLQQLTEVVEELFFSGLTTASAATRQTLSAALQEAARFRLLRLGSALRAANEELGRFTSQDESFSRKRMTFFLSRAWLLSRGLAHALQTADESQYDRLTWSPPVQPLPTATLVCLGVVKRVAAKAFVAFEFRFRAVADAPPVKAGQRLTWSAVFPLKAGLEIPPESYLHLPQKQKFNPACFLDRQAITITGANLALDASGDRLTFNESSTVVVGNLFKEWSRYWEWSPHEIVDRIQKHSAGPLDLDTELQEEIVLRGYELAAPTAGESPGQTLYRITTGKLAFSALVSATEDGKPLREGLERIQKMKPDNRPPLYGLLHYERGALVFQPLSIFKPEPEYLTISSEKINKAALLKALSFT